MKSGKTIRSKKVRKGQKAVSSKNSSTTSCRIVRDENLMGLQDAEKR
jgi:hypothetical protein